MSTVGELAAMVGVTLEAHQAETLTAYAEMVQKWNRAFNLVSRRDSHRLLTRHVIDALSVGPHLDLPETSIDPGLKILDIGSGAGFPGVPLAIAYPQAAVTLLDRSERKARFLEAVRRTLKLANVTVRVADLKPPGRQTPRASQGDSTKGETTTPCYDVVVCRAVAPVERMWPLAHAELKPGGVLLHMAYAVDPQVDNSVGDAMDSATVSESSEDAEGGQMADGLGPPPAGAQSWQRMLVPLPSEGEQRVHMLIKVIADKGNRGSSVSGQSKMQSGPE